MTKKTSKSKDSF